MGMEIAFGTVRGVNDTLGIRVRVSQKQAHL